MPVGGLFPNVSCLELFTCQDKVTHLKHEYDVLTVRLERTAYVNIKQNEI
jgi:hypothetical protein